MADKRTGKLLGMPYDWRKPTWDRVKERQWNADEHRLFVPKVYGWGYDLNVGEALRRLGIRR